MTPKVSIIMPNFNSEKYLNKTIRSVLRQNFKDWELIIVDDKSNKKTIDILKSYKSFKKIKIFFLKIKKGAAFCRNLALKKAKGSYIAFIDSDDIWGEKKLDLQYKFMKENNYAFSYTNYKTFGNKERLVYPPLKYDYHKFIHNTSIATSTMMILKKYTHGVKFTNTVICEDYYFKCAVLKKTKYAYCLNNFLTKYRIRSDSMQSNALKNFLWIWKINKKFNNLNFLENLISLFFISINSLKKYNLRNLS